MDGLVVLRPGDAGRRQQEHPERHRHPPSRHRILLKIIDLLTLSQVQSTCRVSTSSVSHQGLQNQDLDQTIGPGRVQGKRQ